MAVLSPHLSINVTDIDTSVRFYSALLGTPAAKHRRDYAKFEVTEPRLNLSLNLAARSEANGAFNHAGIQVESIEDVIAAKARLTEAGLATFDEMDTTCCYAVLDKIWVRDPDGNPWEVFVTHGDSPDHASSNVEASDDCGCAASGCGCAAESAADVCCS